MVYHHAKISQFYQGTKKKQLFCFCGHTCDRQTDRQSQSLTIIDLLAERSGDQQQLLRAIHLLLHMYSEPCTVTVCVVSSSTGLDRVTDLPGVETFHRSTRSTQNVLTPECLVIRNLQLSPRRLLPTIITDHTPTDPQRSTCTRVVETSSRF